MSFESIQIFRDLPSIDNFVQIPPNKERDKTRVTLENAYILVAGSTIVRLSLGSGRQRGGRCGQQEFLRLPGITPNQWYATDPLALLEAPD